MNNIEYLNEYCNLIRRTVDPSASVDYETLTVNYIDYTMEVPYEVSHNAEYCKKVLVKLTGGVESEEY